MRKPFYAQPTRSSQTAQPCFWIHTFKTRQVAQIKEVQTQSLPPLQRRRHLEILQFLWSKTAQPCSQLMLQNLYRAPLGCSCVSVSPRVQGSSATCDIFGKNAYLFTVLCHQKKSPSSVIFLCLQSRLTTAFIKTGVHQLTLVPKKKLTFLFGKFFYKEETFLFFPF